MRDQTQPLRLVTSARGDEVGRRRAGRAGDIGSAVREPGVTLTANDPRWVLAVRVQEALEGSLLRPEHRERLLKLGRTMRLGPFDANLVIAIVQDRARRGLSLSGGVGQLAMIPRPALRAPVGRRRVVWLTLGALAAEIVLILAIL
ncbi:MAG: hypothetical protein CMJ49_08110 [Planctomycetaceae bacterium]|nr:hypothetical protein [Planctomycetaceae bacterium]